METRALALTFMFIFQHSADAAIEPKTTPRMKICVAGSTVKAITEYGDAFYQGALLAAMEYKSKNFKIEVEKHFYDQTPFAAVKALKKMEKEKCSAVIGFSNMNELKAVKEDAHKLKIPIISIYGELDSTFSGYKNIQTLQPSPKYLIDSFIPSIKKTLFDKNKKVLIVTTVDRTSFLGYRNYYRSLLTKHKIQFEEINLTERAFNIAKFSDPYAQTSQNFDTIIYLSRSNVSAPINDYLSTHTKKRFTVIGTKNFGSSILQSFRRRLKNKDVNAYFPRHGCLCDPSNEYQTFLSSYKKEFNRLPMVISGHTYDAAKFYLNALKNINRSNLKNQWITPLDLYKSIKKTSWKGVTGVTFRPGFKIKLNKSFVLNINKDGYELIKANL